MTEFRKTDGQIFMELKYTPYRHLSFTHFTFPPVIYLIHPTTL